MQNIAKFEAFLPDRLIIRTNCAEKASKLVFRNAIYSSKRVDRAAVITPA